MTVIDRLERCSSFECFAMILAAIPPYPIASAYTNTNVLIVGRGVLCDM